MLQIEIKLGALVVMGLTVATVVGIIALDNAVRETIKSKKKAEKVN